MERDTHIAVLGTFSPADTEGIYTIEVDAETGEMDRLDAAVAGPDPSFVAIDPGGEYLYAAVREAGEGTIRAFEIDYETGALTALNRAPSGANSPCHCSVDATGQFLLVAHYTGGAVSMMPLATDGHIGDPVAVIEHQGSSVDPERQTVPHPHSITPGPENRFVYVPDLGTDQIVVYEMDLEGGTLTRHGVVAVSPGSGPRHLAFHPTTDQVYLINELNSTVVVFDRQEDGLLTERSTVSTLPTDFHGNNKTAEIVAHPTGQYIYGSNRGHDTIAAFAVEGGELALLDHTPTAGEWPRHFVIDPDGRFLFTENRHSDDIMAFSINVDTGKLTPTGERISIPQPVCMQWVPRP